MMPIHQQRDETVLRKRAADLQRRVERLAHFDRLDAEEVADPLADPVHLGLASRIATMVSGKRRNRAIITAPASQLP